MQNNLILKAPIMGFTGYSIVARKLINALYNLKPNNVSLEEFKWVYSVSAGYNFDDIKSSMHAKKNKFKKEDTALIHLSIASEFEENKGYALNCAYSMFETNSIPFEWVNGCNKLDRLFVPTKFNKQTFSNAGVTKPIDVLPFGVDTDFFNPNTAKFKTFPNTFNFLSVCLMSDRKSYELIIRAFLELFSQNSDVSLVLRWYLNPDNPEDYKIVQNYIRSVRDEMKIYTGNIFIINQVEESMMNSLYTSSNVLLAPFRGEGWGLPIIEAASCEIPVIATNWGGVTEYLTDEETLLLDYKLSPVPKNQRADYWMNIAGNEGHFWAEPNYQQLKEYMIEVYNFYPIYKIKAKKLRRKLVDNFQWKHTAEKLLCYLGIN